MIDDLLGSVAKALNITRPLAAFDLETTGVSVEQDRIIEITIGRVEPGRVPLVLRELVNPGRPIPKTASDIHGITDEAVKGKPAFSVIARMVAEMLAGADIIGYNHRRFDVALLAAECKRAGLKDPCEGARLIDVYRIFQKREPRDLAGAVRFYCGEDHAGAHGTTADVSATLQVLLAQFDRYGDLPRAIDELNALNRDPSWIDKDGKLAWQDGQACLNFGKYKGVPLKSADRSYLSWVVVQEWCQTDTKKLLTLAMRGTYPVRGGAA